jgi:hypothetical protein
MTQPTQPPQQSQPPPQQQGMGALLTSLASGGDNWVKLGIIAMLVLGGGNLFVSKQSGDSANEEMQRALKEIHSVYGVLDATIERQKRVEQMVTDIKTKLDKQQP